jgi:hypothetical protein
MSLVETVEGYPSQAQVAFQRINEAVNLVFPGSDSHDRYRDIGEVGLAIVVAQDWVERDSYNPFNPETLERLAFHATNQDTHGEAWTPKDTDEGMLGGTVPEGMGRFTAFALAKINGLLDHHFVSSVRPSIAIARGKVGLAGGQRLYGRTLLGTSGLWEVHDHFVGRVFEDELEIEVYGRPGRTVDDTAGKIEAVVGRIQKLHEGVDAASLSRSAIEELVLQNSAIYSGAIPGESVT